MITTKQVTRDKTRIVLLANDSEKHKTTPNAGLGGAGDHQSLDRYGGGRLPGLTRIPHAHHLYSYLYEAMEVENARAIVFLLTLSSRGWCSTSRTWRRSSGSSSRRSTLWWASEISPGKGTKPPPNKPALVMMSAGAWREYGRRGFEGILANPSGMQLCDASLQAESPGLSLGGVSRCREQSEVTEAREVIFLEHPPRAAGARPRKPGGGIRVVHPGSARHGAPTTPRPA
jgi:hypothetical protein